MDYLTCTKRQKLHVVNRNGEKDTKHQCCAETAEAFGQFVTPEICAACPVRIHIAKQAAKAAADPAVQVRTDCKGPVQKDTTADPTWVSCETRNRAVLIKCCGQQDTVRICTSIEAPTRGKQVSPETCAGCPFRKPASKN